MRPFLLLALLLFASCQKEVIIATEESQPSYRLSGLSNVSFYITPFQRYDRVLEQRLYILYMSGRQKKVSVRLEGLPPTLKGSLSGTSGYADFSVDALVLNDGAVAGEYKPQIVLTSEEDSAQIYPFKITVIGDGSCTNYMLTKSYEASDGPGGAYRPVKVEVLDSATSLFSFEGILQNNERLQARINCAAQKFVVPFQQLGSTTYSGSGDLVFQGAGVTEIKFILDIASPSGNFRDEVFLRLNP